MRRRGRFRRLHCCVLWPRRDQSDELRAVRGRGAIGVQAQPELHSRDGAVRPVSESIRWERSSASPLRVKWPLSISADDASADRAFVAWQIGCCSYGADHHDGLVERRAQRNWRSDAASALEGDPAAPWTCWTVTSGPNAACRCVDSRNAGTDDIARASMRSWSCSEICCQPSTSGPRRASWTCTEGFESIRQTS